MKRIIFSLFAALALLGCENIEDNSPAMQGTLNEEFFKATAAIATRVSGSGGAYVIQGQTDDQLLTLRVPRPQAGTYVIEGNPEVYASYKDLNGNTYLTDPLGEGEIVINRWDTTDKTLSGTFRFTAYAFGIDTLLVHRGVFYLVPYTIGEEIEDPGVGTGTMVANIDGEIFQPPVAGGSNNQITIRVVGMTEEARIELRLPIDVQVGNYDITEEPFFGKYTTAEGITFTGESGNITVIQHDVTSKNIRGAFSFTTPGDHTISQGQFNVSY